jgi:alpha-1,3-rhamnosyl/mannosyltransferase
VKILLDVSSVTVPLSGIGRYALELARNLPLQDQVEELVFLDNGRVLEQFDPATPRVPEASGRLRQLARQILPYDWVLRPYRRRRARQTAEALDDFRDYIYFSPNFSLPPVASIAVATLHDLSVYHYPQFHPRDRVNYLRDQISHSVERADCLVTDSEFIRSELLQLFSVPPRKVVHVPLGVDPSFRPRGEEDLAPCMMRYGLSAGRYFLSVGTVEPRKNLERLLQAYMSLDPTLRRSCPLVIVGAYGWASESLMTEIRRLQAAGEVKYLDYVSEEDLPFIYAGACALCYFSLYEGFGLPVLEAMSSGVPVLCSAASALPELCVDAGELVEPTDVSAMSQAMQRALEDREWCEQSALLGREHSNAYTWARTAQRLVTVFGDLG